MDLPPGFDRLEFHRQALALAPRPDDGKPGVAVIMLGTKDNPEYRRCSCTTSRKKTCPHILELTRLYKAFLNHFRETPSDLFENSIWYRLAKVLADKSRERADRVQCRWTGGNGDRFLKLRDSRDQEVAIYYSCEADAVRLAERLNKLPDDAVPNRHSIIDQLVKLTYTIQEQELTKKGFPTFRLIFERSPWYRLAYHCFHEFGRDGVLLEPEVDLDSGNFTVACRHADRKTIIRFIVPRDKVRSVIQGLQEQLPNQQGMPIHPIPLKSIFKVSRNTELDLEVRPMIQLMQKNGEQTFYDSEEFERFRYGDLIFVKNLGIMAELERESGRQRRFAAPIKMVLKKSQVPQFLEEHHEDLENGRVLIDQELSGMRIIQEFDRFLVMPDAIDRDWCWLDVRYGFGNTSLSLAEIIQARKNGQRYIATAQGWVDCQAAAFDGLDFIEPDRIGSSDRIRFSRTDLLRLKTTTDKPAEMQGDSERTELINRLWQLKPAGSTELPQTMTSTLRNYQVLGYHWLYFLFENRLGGLLCDEMGLGKTHQTMALMAAIAEQELHSGPVLIVCPTSVLSHWHNKIGQHVPTFKTTVYHGPQRNLDEALKRGGSIITSYGVLLQDSDRLSRIEWSLAVFDEIQNIKNSQTQTHRAALEISAQARIGLTGTPIENRLEELKTLFDVVLPGYLDRNRKFTERYIKPIEADPESPRRKELGRMISPFILRRLKKSVLTELPDKIENVLTSELSDDQIKLYRDAVESRGRELIDAIRQNDRPVPYIHIFSLLTLLKRICDHPAIVSGEVERYMDSRCGKWDLFKEILQECLDSGKKVVVYSQYLDMLRIIEYYLQETGTGYVTLTGQSRDRGPHHRSVQPG